MTDYSRRPRTTSTPIGYLPQAVVRSTLHSDEVDGNTSDDSRDEGHSGVGFSEDSWEQVGSHSGDSQDSHRPRTLKIVSSSKPGSSSQPASKKQKKADAPLTKKQRQNAAKKAKQKEEKALMEERQAAALRAHKKAIEKQRIESIKPASTFSTGDGAWRDNDWETVSKSKKSTSTASHQPDASSDLIWQ